MYDLGCKYNALLIKLIVIAIPCFRPCGYVLISFFGEIFVYFLFDQMETTDISAVMSKLEARYHGKAGYAHILQTPVLPQNAEGCYGL